MTPVPHPPYSPNLAPDDFFCVPWLKKFLKGKRLANVEEVKQKMAEALKGIKINEFKNWKKKILIGILHHMESVFEGDQNLNMWE